MPSAGLEWRTPSVQQHLRTTPDPPRELTREIGDRPPDTIFYGLALARVGLGALEDARAAAKRASRTSNGHRLKRAMLSYVYMLSGRRSEAEEILNSIPQDERENCIPLHIALIYSALYEKDQAGRERHADQAFHYLSLAVAQHDYWVLWLAVDPRLDALRSQLTRFDSLLGEVKLPPRAI